MEDTRDLGTWVRILGCTGGANQGLVDGFGGCLVLMKEIIGNGGERFRR